MNTNPRQVTLDLMYLVRCALAEENPSPEIVAAMDLQAVCQTSADHSMTALAWTGLGNQQGLCSPELAAFWKDLAERATRKALLLDIGREEILSALAQAGIWHLPLKGSLLQNFYPMPGLREMSDNDILFDRTRREDMIRIMESLGYATELGNLDDHDVFTKPTVYNYEMHPAIIGDEHGEPLHSYYKNFEEKLLPGEEGPFSRRMRDEDFYIFLIVHAYKHYITSGIGLRILPDLHVYLGEMEAELDWDYIGAEFDKLGVRAFDAHLRLITQRVFNDPQSLTEEDWQVLDYCETSGTHGSQTIKATNAIRSLQDGEGPVTWSTKLRYLWRRVWPDKLTCQLFFPFFAKYPFLKPFLVIYRLVRLVLFRRHLLKAELDAMKTSSEK